MEGASETSANFYQITWNHITKYSNLHNYHCELHQFPMCKMPLDSSLRRSLWMFFYIMNHLLLRLLCLLTNIRVITQTFSCRLVTIKDWVRS